MREGSKSGNEKLGCGKSAVCRLALIASVVIALWLAAGALEGCECEKKPRPPNPLWKDYAKAQCVVCSI